jgi:hypothetical protein
MTNRAPVFGGIVDDRFVTDQDGAAADSLLAWGHGNVTGDASVADAKVSVHDLAQLHRNGAFVGTRARLDAPPVFEEVFLGRGRKQQDKNASAGDKQQVLVPVHRAPQCLGQSAGDQ